MYSKNATSMHTEDTIKEIGDDMELPQSWDLTVQSDVGMSIRSLYMITVVFCLYDFRIFPLKSGILLRELSLKY